MIGSEIRAARLRAGLTQEGLARQIDVTMNTVARWERGEFAPSPELAAKLADVLGLRYEPARLADR